MDGEVVFLWVSLVSYLFSHFSSPLTHLSEVVARSELVTLPLSDECLKASEVNLRAVPKSMHRGGRGGSLIMLLSFFDCSRRAPVWYPGVQVGGCVFSSFAPYSL